MKLSLIALVLLGVTVAAEEQATEASLVGLDELVSEFEDAEDAEDASSRRRRRRRWHRHRPHRHRPHRHWPHGHRPHHHAPHGHRPHFHAPHGHRPHFHFPHGHRPHIHHPHAHVPHGHRPHVHHPHAHVPHLHHPHHHRPGSFFSRQFWVEFGHMTDHNMNAFFNDALGVGPALNYFFGVIDAGWWDVFVPAMVEFGDAFCAAFVEVYLFMEWLFVGGGICNITAKDWEQTLGNTWSVGGLEELGNLDKWHNVEEKTNDLLMIACSVYWMILEYCYLWLSFAIACIGMMIKKCKVLGGSNPSIETALSLSSTLTMGFAGLPPIFIQVKPMISAGVAFCITSFAEKQCYIYFSIGVKYSVIFPPLEGYKFDCCEMDMCLVINGYPTKDGYCNGWGIAGTLTCAPFMCGGNPTPIHIEMRCVFFYRNYWFKFNSISLRCVISISLPYVKFAWSAEIGLTTMKIWVAVCVMARVAKTCRMFYTGEDPNYEKAWNNYQNDGFVPTMNPGDQAGAFSGYGTN